ncbi:MAG: hypothetical protein P8Y24_12045 [Gammaproteobacteria bacterium]
MPVTGSQYEIVILLWHTVRNFVLTSRIARWGWLLFLPRFGCSRSHLPDRNYALIIFFAIGLLFISSNQNAQALELTSDSQLATAGYYQLSWSGDTDIFQLQESMASDFNNYKVIYEGKDLARVVSGKPDGDYYYRIKVTANNSPQAQVSNVVKVTVSHHPLQTAILFFLAGAIVFIAILVLILKGNKLANN